MKIGRYGELCKLMYQLILMKNKMIIGQFVLKPGFTTLGRSKDRDISIDDENITRHHAQVQVDLAEEIFLFEDLGSLNGSYINQIKTTQQILKKGDVIQLGVHHLMFEEALP